MSNLLDYKKKTLFEMDNKILGNSLHSMKKELFNLRFQKTLGELSNSSAFSKLKKNIARVETELTRRKKIGAE